MSRPFGRIEPWLLEASARLSKNELRVLLELLFRAGASRSCWPSQAKIAADLGEPGATGERKVREALRGLEAKGFLSVRRTQRTNVYLLAQPAEIPPVGARPQPAEIPPVQPAENPPPQPAENSPVRPAENPPTEQNRNREEDRSGNRAKPETLELELPKEPDGVERLFALWQEATGRKRSRLDAERRKWLERGIKTWGFPTASEIVAGVAFDEFAMGTAEPERYQGRPKSFNEPRHLFAKAERSEYFLALARDRADGGEELDAGDLRERFLDLFLGFVSEAERTPAVASVEDCKLDPKPRAWRELRGTRVPVWEIADLDHFAVNFAATRWAAKELSSVRGAEFLTRPELESAKADFAHCLARASERSGNGGER